MARVQSSARQSRQNQPEIDSLQFVFTNFFKATLILSVSGKWIEFIFKICQTVAGIFKLDPMTTKKMSIVHDGEANPRLGNLDYNISLFYILNTFVWHRLADNCRKNLLRLGSFYPKGFGQLLCPKFLGVYRLQLAKNRLLH